MKSQLHSKITQKNFFECQKQQNPEMTLQFLMYPLKDKISLMTPETYFWMTQGSESRPALLHINVQRSKMQRYVLTRAANNLMTHTTLSSLVLHGYQSTCSYE
jgi:hypothetical protein